MGKTRDSSEARTVGEFMSALNDEFGWSLPTSEDLTQEPELEQIWSLEVTVSESPRPAVIYEARTKDSFVFIENLKGKLVITVRQRGDAPPA
jgi:hypothetical protein